jgi:hypothetical protein
MRRLPIRRRRRRRRHYRRRRRPSCSTPALTRPYAIRWPSYEHVVNDDHNSIKNDHNSLWRLRSMMHMMILRLLLFPHYYCPTTKSSNIDDHDDDSVASFSSLADQQRRILDYMQDDQFVQALFVQNHGGGAAQPRDIANLAWKFGATQST